MNVSKLVAAPIFVIGMTLGSNVHAAPISISLHPTVLTLDVQDCGANRNLSSSVKITTKVWPVLQAIGLLRFEFKNIGNGQISVKDYNTMVTNHEFSLPGGYYTFRAFYRNKFSNQVHPKSVELVYGTPISVPTISATGQCLPTVDPRQR